MNEEPRIHRVEVSFVGTPPARQVERASGVSEVTVEDSILRCLVCGSFQPFIEALAGHEVIDITSVPIVSPGVAPRRQGPDRAATTACEASGDVLTGVRERADRHSGR